MRAPKFSVATNGGGKISLADYAGKMSFFIFIRRTTRPAAQRKPAPSAIILPISRKRARSSSASALTGEGARQVRGEIQLPFTLLADEDKKIVEAYGVWGEKSFMGRKYIGTHRVTFLIGPDGKIKKIWPKVKPEEHAAEVLAALVTAGPFPFSESMQLVWVERSTGCLRRQVDPQTG